MNKKSLPQYLFIIISVLLFIILPILAVDSGPNADEDVESVYGKDIYNYWANGDKQALNYDNHELGMHIKSIEYYGGLVNLLGEVSHQWLGVELKAARHFFVAIFGALMMLFAGLLAWRLSKRNWWIGLVGLLFMVFSPRLFGESFHNGKDIPYAASAVIAVYASFAIIELFSQSIKKLMPYLLLLAFGFFLAFSSRPAGGILIVGYSGLSFILYYLLNSSFRKELVNKENKTGKKIIYLIVASLLGYAVALIFWPFGLQNPVGSIFAALNEMSNRDTNFRMFFDGEYIRTKEVPWYYTLKWIFISSPIIATLSFVGFIIAGLKISKTYSKFALIIVLFCAAFPILYTIAKHSTLLDSWRHSFFVFPFWAVGAALFIGWLTTVIKSKKMVMIPIFVAIVGLVPEMAWTFTTTPYQSIYFNAFVGGIKGAQSKYELDYYQLTGKEIKEWIIANAKPRVEGTPVQFMTNMDAIFIDEKFMQDTTRFRTLYGRYYERHTLNWDYYGTFGRFVDEWQLVNNTWPPCDAVHNILLKGVPIATILHRKSDAAFLGATAIQSKQFEEAVRLYAIADAEQPLCNEMELFFYGLAAAQSNQVDLSMSIINRAISINGEIPEFYDVIAELYHMKGDKANAEKYKRTATSVKATKALKK